MSLPEILKFASDYGVTLVLACIVVFGVWSGVRLFFKYLDRYLNKQIPAERDEPKTAEAIPAKEAQAVVGAYPTPVPGSLETNSHCGGWGAVRKHPVFVDAATLSDIRIPRLSFGDTGRTKVFRDLLCIYIDVWSEILVQLVDRAASRDMTDAQDFISHNQLAIVSALETAEEMWRAEGIPEQVIEKYLVWAHYRIDNLLDDVQLVAYSRATQTFPDKMFEALTLYRSALRGTILEAEAALCLLNGELTGLAYGDLVIGPDVRSTGRTVIQAVFQRRKDASGTDRVGKLKDDASTSRLVSEGFDTGVAREKVARKKSGGSGPVPQLQG